MGPRPAFDAPVCGPAEQESEDTSSGCILCSAYESTYGLSQSFPPSCFKINRAFYGRGLRKQYMTAAAEMLSGPLRLCRINAKLDRWKALIEEYVAEDASQGTYPAIEGQDAYFPDFDSHFNWFKTTAVPAQIEIFRQDVTCGEGGTRYHKSQWGEMYTPPVGEMIEIANFPFDMDGWKYGGPFGLSANAIMGIGLGVGLGGGLLLLAAVAYMIKKNSCKPSTGQRAFDGKVSVSSTASAASGSAASQSASMPVAVALPPGMVAGQALLVDSPKGGQIFVKALAGCSSISVTVPKDAAVAYVINCAVPSGITTGQKSDDAIIANVEPGSAAEAAGFRAGQKIVTVDGAPIYGANASEACTQRLNEATNSISIQVTTWEPDVKALN